MILSRVRLWGAPVLAVAIAFASLAIALVSPGPSETVTFAVDVAPVLDRPKPLADDSQAVTEPATSEPQSSPETTSIALDEAEASNELEEFDAFIAAGNPMPGGTRATAQPISYPSEPLEYLPAPLYVRWENYDHDPIDGQPIKINEFFEACTDSPIAEDGEKS